MPYILFFDAQHISSMFDTMDRCYTTDSIL